MSVRLNVASIIVAFSAVALACGASSPMKTYEVNVVGSRVSIDLHPDMSPPGAMPEGVGESRIPTPGSSVEFVNLMYDYKRRWHLNVDGAVIVAGSVMRRAAVHRDAGVSFLDADRWMAAFQRGDKESKYEKVDRGDRTWLKRSRLNDVMPGLGRSNQVEWLMPVKEDIIIIIEVRLRDYATKASRTDASWYIDAEALHRHILDSVRVELPTESGSAGAAKKGYDPER